MEAFLLVAETLIHDFSSHSPFVFVPLLSWCYLFVMRWNGVTGAALIGVEADMGMRGRWGFLTICYLTYDYVWYERF